MEIERKITLSVLTAAGVVLGTIAGTGAPDRSVQAQGGVETTDLVPANSLTPTLTATARAITTTANGLIADENGHYPVPGGQTRREPTPPARVTATVAPTAVIHYSSGVHYQPPIDNCPANSHQVNERLGIEDSPLNWWVQNLRTFVWEGTLGDTYTVTIPAGAVYSLNGQQGQMVTSSGINNFVCPRTHPVTGTLPHKIVGR